MSDDLSKVGVREGRFADWSTKTLADQCHMQAREQLDPEFTQFMTAVGNRLAALENCAGEDAQLNLYRQAERDRETRRNAEEAFDLIAPFVAKFAEAVKHYDGGRPRYQGSVMTHDADPSYRPVLCATATGAGGPGAPASPTLGDLRFLSDAYAEAVKLRRATPAVHTRALERHSREG